MGSSFDTAIFGHLAETYGLQEQSKAELTAIADSIRSSLFRQQQDLLTDPCRRKAALCPRRAGKSYSAMSYAYDVCLRKAGARVVIINVSQKTGKTNYWFEMSSFIQKFGIPAKMYQNELRVQLSNGSMIWLAGADKRDAIEKLRGAQFDLVIIDECKSYPAFLLNELILEVINPTLKDRRGTILLIGTPGSILAGQFFAATYPGFTVTVGKGKSETTRPVSRCYADPEPYWDSRPKDKTYWSRHAWTVQDNVSQPHIWLELLEDKAVNGWADDEPIWLREALGQWVASSDEFVYAYANLASTDGPRVHWSPDFENGNQFGLSKTEDWRYLLGIDLGFNDAFAMVIGAYNVHEGVLYHVWDYHQTKLDAIEAAEKICATIERFGKFDAIVIDSGALGKMITEAYRSRYAIPAKPAEKREKFAYIELLNADFRAGRVKIRAKSDLAVQLCTLQFDMTSGKSLDELARREKLVENQSQKNDLTDAFLYLWRYSYHYWAKSRAEQPAEYGTAAWYAQREQRAMDAAVAARGLGANRPAWSSWQTGDDPLKEYRFDN